MNRYLVAGEVAATDGVEHPENVKEESRQNHSGERARS